MAKSLVIVESPAKAKTIEKYLGKKFTVKASMGHVVDLPKSQYGVDVKDGFKPKYIKIRGKAKLINDLKESANKADAVYLATDPDREGEAISWHLANVLDLGSKYLKRIEFHEITKRAVEDSLKHPRDINMNLVNAQQARRILDRIVGYELSPLLWKKVRRGLSAGRVQSVALRLICEREQEIKDFVIEEYWSIVGNFKTESNKEFAAKLLSVAGKKVQINNEAQAKEIEAYLKKEKYAVTDVKKKERQRTPAPPFNTSSLQQEAGRKLGFGARKTMMIAQQLYEGLELGEAGVEGVITYIRTDSVRVAVEAQTEARQVISERFGSKFLPEKPPVYKTKNTSAQEAHEAIRPTSIFRHPDTIKMFLTRDQFRLYQLVWFRFIASQMSPAIFDTVVADIKGGHFLLRANGNTLKFPGFLEVYQEGRDDDNQEKEERLPELTPGDILKMINFDLKQHFTQPPPRYTESSLIKILEEKGIGRPSTYAPTIDTIVKRNYILIEEKKLKPTDLGQIVVELLKEKFSKIVDYDFTAEMEASLDKIEEGETNWVKVLEQFYQPFNQEVQEAKESLEKVEVPLEVSDIPCDKCGRMMVYKFGRFGRFLACPGYPECKNTKPIKKIWNVKCPKCGEGEIIERKSKKGRVFFGCNRYPECDFLSWERPYQTACPQCGSMMVVKGGKLDKTAVCLKAGCNYTEKLEKI